MFERTFIPYLSANGWSEGMRDPLDQSIAAFVSSLTKVDLYAICF